MLDIAIDAAKQAGELALKYFKTQPKVTYKPDKSPVTRTDIEAEKLIRKIISKNFPDHGIIGEELPPLNPKAMYQWTVDPIDGTRDFIRGIPYWAVFIALLKENRPVAAVAYLPAMDKIITAEKDQGTFINTKRTKVSNTKKLSLTYMSFGSIKRFQKTKYLDGFLNLTETVSAPRSYGNLGLLFLLEGKIDVLLESQGGVYDFAAPALLVEEAGGKFSDFTGKFSLKSGNAVLSNRLLHNQVLKLLNEK